MSECKYCGEEFDSKEELHIHWGEEHEDELSSHDQEKVKKAKRKREERSQDKMRKRKQYAGYALGGALALILVGLVGAQLMNSGGSAAFETLDQQPMMGEEDAPITVVEFGDYQCPHCGDFEFQSKPQLKKNFIDTGQVKFYFINFPVTGPGANQAAVASECVYQEDPDQFWDYHNTVFQNQGQAQGQMNTDFLMEMARQSTEGLDYEGLRSCIENRETMDKVKADQQEGQKNGVSSTPTIYMNGEQIRNWEYNNLAQKINNALNEN